MVPSRFESFLSELFPEFFARGAFELRIILLCRDCHQGEIERLIPLYTPLLPGDYVRLTSRFLAGEPFESLRERVSEVYLRRFFNTAGHIGVGGMLKKYRRKKFSPAKVFIGQQEGESSFG